MRVVVTGWASFLHGEATAGDVASLQRVAARLADDGIEHDVVWSPGFAPGSTHFDDVDPSDYTHLLFCCGPVHGWQVEDLHHRFFECTRIAVGVSVVDPESPAARCFHRLLPRDGPGLRSSRDLAAGLRHREVPVLGAVLAPDQPEYGDSARHEQAHDLLQHWLSGLDAARVPLDTRLAHDDWRHCATPEAFASLIARTDLVVTTRLHGLVFALSEGVPAIAVDPVTGGGKVTAQAQAHDWPAVLGPGSLSREELDHWWDWCRSDAGARRAAEVRDAAGTGPALLDAVARELHASLLDQ
ncbi:polysaccharide pyruvyl transferase family protein [Saccharopolyspora rhizosphaerae]|uniref:Polysaccharide pyruvyl transferase family protein n=1 Tax=Saccharopolyspora rhizosphaerae TaxID=2492662 RepID=A0A426JMQ7_9PSEU|nr:polysaccharide pyruvyl transferase family protein [Saccharopolyspora rhizosphaerae]RRO14330.1 polysaccharide pyruvyl transferase family protein [Saccharopolyspora rhizosphaerae]